MRKVFFSCPEFDFKFKLVVLLLCVTAYQVQANEGKTVDFNSEIQKRIITGVVKDASGMPLPGANVLVKGTTNGVVTDFDGEFQLEIEASATTLVVSYVGYEEQEVVIGEKSVFSIVLNESQEALDEVVIVGFGTQKKASLVSSITTISPKEIKGPTSNLTTMMAGRVSGMIAVQRSGEPGADNSDFFIRGLGSFGSGKVNPLILIDGIESTTTDMARLQPDDIESFSVLKDAAAAAVYGARGANGVVLITTKMGKAGKTQFQLRSETRISSNTRNFKFADNITYMQLANEAALTRDPQATLPYTQNKIYRTSIGDDPYLYPSNNWIDELIKDYTVNQGLNFSAQGGGEKAKYYIAGTYNVDNGVLDVDPINNFNNNIKLRNYSVRSNLDMNLTPTTKGIVRVYGQFDDYNGPVGGRDVNGNWVNGGARIFNLTLWSNPVKFPKVYPSSYLPFIDHPLFGGAQATNNSGSAILINPYAEMVRGYQTNKASTIQAQVEIKQDLAGITEGLSARAMGYVRRYSYYEVARQYNPFYYEGYISPFSGELELNVLNDGGQGSVGVTGTEYLDYSEGRKDLDSRIYLETAINYNRVFNEKHAVSGMLVNLLSSYETGNAGSVQSSLPNRNHSLSGRFTYGYDDKYLFEFNFGYNGSERFANGARYGYFPSLGLAYRISKEDWWDGLRDVVSDFKLRFTYGLVGNDAIGNVNDRFFYLSNVNLNDGRYGTSFGEQFNNSRPGVYIDRYANPNIGWEKSRQTNVGFDLELFNSLNIIVDVFKQNRTNILQERSNIGATMGLTAIPATNFGKMESKGLDASLTYDKSFNQDWYTQLRGNFTFSTNEVLEFDEVTYPEELSYRSRVGQNASQWYGYIAERLFIDDKEVANSPTQFGEVRGGDIKYRDVNGDGQISSLDMVPIGHPTVPEIVYGFGGTLGFKNFDFSIFFQGVARTSFFINPWNISPFVINGSAQNGLLKVIADDHWSEDNRDSYAFWPRLGGEFNENNNVFNSNPGANQAPYASTWWMRDGSFLRLKTIEAGYNFPEKFVTKLGMQSARLYFSGNNLAVWSPFKLWDPEMGGNGLGYPIQSVYNLGLKLDF
ncbi:MULTISPECIES: SusC/RagA family TonB-linked outer membrane protein [Aestuariibaculum]|uniref:TonB-dependent receptor n=1 Tax=Aestuariibaculum lutulentum TaxID=2920935 RepID=A0ABS9RDV2_9FLAO|nr:MULTISPECIES: TonB-dependent receptor [Aestuariibaculum]MCH4551118.1 TonB-dependent receptor [Aestuariibaculum lutulentum]MCR8666183.1 TonB-dependent receptor [Aestuariibaculum sp. M13]